MDSLRTQNGSFRTQGQLRDRKRNTKRWVACGYKRTSRRHKEAAFLLKGAYRGHKGIASGHKGTKINTKGRKGTARRHLRTQRVTSQHYITILFMMIMKTCF